MESSQPFQTPLFEASSQQRILLDDDSVVNVYPSWLPATDASDLIAQLQQQVPWQQPTIQVYGTAHKIPRLQAWFGDPHASMRYSGTEFQPTPWLPVLQRVKSDIEACCGHAFNSVLVNLYRDGNDSVGWHADDETELGAKPFIASLSLGEARYFCFKPKPACRRESTERRRILLHHGDLLTMAGKTQENWQHALLKERAARAPRINLTFRYIITS